MAAPGHGCGARARIALAGPSCGTDANVPARGHVPENVHPRRCPRRLCSTGFKAATRSVFALVLVGTYVGVGALAHDYGFGLVWLLTSTLLIWAAPAQVILMSALGAGAAPLGRDRGRALGRAAFADGGGASAAPEDDARARATFCCRRISRR